MGSPSEAVTIIIFVLTYAAVALGWFPFVRLDRTGAAVVGASLMVAFGALTIDEASRAIDLETLVLLFGMMIVVASLRLSGFFRLIAAHTVEHVHRPLVLLISVIAVTGVLSAFFVNDTICLVLTPLMYEIASSLRRNPVPYLLAIAMSSNIGSVATITGNPQNILIGSFSHIPYREFTAALAPVSLVGFALTTILLYFGYRDEFRDPCFLKVEPLPDHVNRPLMWKSLAVALAMIVFFFLGTPIPKVAIVAGGFLLVTRRVRPEKFHREIDFSLLTLFAGLFVVVAGIEKTALFARLVDDSSRLALDRVPVMSAVSGVLSNIVSNVPAVLILKSFVTRLADPHRAWLALAMSSTLAGNFTLVGSVANLIVVERAQKHNIRITFWEYFRIGAPLTLLTMAAGVLLLR